MNTYHWTPETWANMGKREKAIVIAGIDIRVKQEEKANKAAKKK